MDQENRVIRILMAGFVAGVVVYGLSTLVGLMLYRQYANQIMIAGS